MQGATLNKYISSLSGKQQEYIVHCVRDYSDMTDFHRGVLPFLSVQTAVTCLKIRLERVREKTVPLDVADAHAVGVRFINGILSKFEAPYRIAEGEVSVKMHLCDRKLGMMFYRRYGQTFIISIDSWSKDDVVHLEKLGKNKWRVTAPTNRVLDKATTFLGQEFNI